MAQDGWNCFCRRRKLEGKSGRGRVVKQSRGQVGIKGRTELGGDIGRTTSQVKARARLREDGASKTPERPTG